MGKSQVVLGRPRYGRRIRGNKGLGYVFVKDKYTALSGMEPKLTFVFEMNKE